MTTRIIVSMEESDNTTSVRVRTLDARNKEVYPPTILNDGDAVGFTIHSGQRLDIRESEE